MAGGPDDDAPDRSWASLGLSGEEAAPDSSFGIGDEQRYDPGGLLGRGGYGEVRQVHDGRLGRSVARKRGRLADPEARAELIREARLTARLQHPGIVSVYDAGVDAEGEPFYTMPVLAGRSLADALEDCDGLGARLGLVRHVLGVAEAVAYAHGQGVLHRDIKPANVMVGGFGETVLTDWGLACTREEGAEGAGGVVGTPGFMSPEAAAGGPLDERADVYGLGACLAAVLLGERPPHAPVPALSRLVPEAPPELAAIADRALAPDPDARYAGPAALAADLAAWYEGRRVSAHDYSVGELVRRLVQAWRAPLLVAAVGLCTVAVAVGVGWTRTAAERDRAEVLQHEAEEARAAADRNLGRALAVQARRAAEDGLPARAELLAAHALLRGEDPLARGVLARFGGRARMTEVSRQAIPRCDQRRVSVDGRYLACDHQGTLRILELSADGEAVETRSDRRVDALDFVGPEPVLLVVWEDGEAERWHPAEGWRPLGSAGRGPYLLFANEAVPLAVGQGASTVLLLDASSGEVGRVEACAPPAGRPVAAAVDDAGRVYVACSDRTLWRVRPGAEATLLGRTSEEEGAASVLAVSGDPRARLVVGTVRGDVVVLDATDGTRLHALAAGYQQVRDLDLVDDRLVVAMVGGTVRVHDLAQDRPLGRLESSRPWVEWVDDGRLLRIVGAEVATWQVPAPGLPERFVVPEGVAGLAVSPTAPLVAAGLGDGSVHLLPLEPGASGRVLQWTDQVAKDVAFDPSGAWLAVASADPAGPQRVYRTADWQPVELPVERGLRRVAWLGNGVLLGARYGAPLTRWRLDAVSGTPEALDGAPQVWDLEASPDGRSAVGLGWGDVALWTDGQTVRSLGALPGAAAVATRGDEVLLGGPEGIHAVGDDGEVQLRWPAHAGVLDLAVSPDGRLVAAGHYDGTTSLWRVGQAAPVAVLEGHASRVSAVAFSPDGDWLFSGSWDRTVRAWSLARLDRPADQLVAELEATWGRSLADLLGGESLDPEGATGL